MHDKKLALVVAISFVDPESIKDCAREAGVSSAAEKSPLWHVLNLTFSAYDAPMLSKTECRLGAQCNIKVKSECFQI